MLEIQCFPPGSLLVARVSMRAWESESVRGLTGHVIESGHQVLLVVSWLVGNQVRLKVVRNDRIMMFSCPAHVVHKNWDIATQAIEKPALG